MKSEAINKVDNKVYELNQRMVAAMDRLAVVHETIEDTWDVVVKESVDGDMLFASKEDVVDKLEADHAIEALEDCRKNLDSTFTEFSNYHALHEAA